MQILRIPKDRVAVVIGKEGATKKELEAKLNATLNIDSDIGEIEIVMKEPYDAVQELRAVDIIRAVGRGFSPEKALNLLDDNFYFEVIDIKEYAGKSQKHIARLKARVIGTGGRTRKLIEELTGAYISIYGSTVSIIGELESLNIAKRAMDMLLSGCEHSTVYRYLERAKAL
ncbi:MAG: KH domain-containing protein [Candidatus Thermoplasmatota archaeon]